MNTLYKFLLNIIYLVKRKIFLTETETENQNYQNKNTEENNDIPKNKRPLYLALWTSIAVIFVIICVFLLHCRQAAKKLESEKYSFIPSR